MGLGPLPSWNYPGRLKSSLSSEGGPICTSSLSQMTILILEGLTGMPGLWRNLVQ